MKKGSIFNLSAWLLGFGLLLSTSSCDEEEKPSIGNPPSQADAAFTYQASSASDNIIEFKASNPSLDASWDFGNGATAKGSEVTATYPFAGTYEVTLTVQNSGGSASSSQEITIDQDDPALVNNPLYAILTGGSSKTWAIDSVGVAHFGVGPNPIGAAGYYPEYYAAASLEKAGAGMYDDRYTFKLQGFGYDMVTNGDVYVNSDHAGIPPFDDTTASIVGDYTAQFPDQLGENWTLIEGNSDTTITFSGDAFAGYWAGTRTYQIINIEEEELFLRYVDAINTDLAWYIRLVPEGSGSNPPPPVPKYSLPLDFENEDPEWTTFGNSTYQIINNPDASGINTSGRVLETVHGNETWAGLFVNLENNLDFSAQTTIKLKVWAPITGTFRMKLESQADPNNFVEVDATVNATNSWEELTFDFSGTPTEYDRLVIFPGWNVANAGTFYVDDIVQE